MRNTASGAVIQIPSDLGCGAVPVSKLRKPPKRPPPPYGKEIPRTTNPFVRYSDVTEIMARKVIKGRGDPGFTIRSGRALDHAVIAQELAERVHLPERHRIEMDFLGHRRVRSSIRQIDRLAPAVVTKMHECQRTLSDFTHIFEDGAQALTVVLLDCAPCRHTTDNARSGVPGVRLDVNRSWSSLAAVGETVAKSVKVTSSGKHNDRDVVLECNAVGVIPCGRFSGLGLTRHRAETYVRVRMGLDER